MALCIEERMRIPRGSRHIMQHLLKVNNKVLTLVILLLACSVCDIQTNND